jgi:hypothetical protein
MVSLRVRVPLDIGNVPGATLGKKTGYFEGGLEVQNEQTAATTADSQQ